jgi:integrase
LPRHTHSQPITADVANEVAIIVDFVHVLEYLWKAATRCQERMHPGHRAGRARRGRPAPRRKCGSPRDTAISLLLLCTGLRVEELQNLDLADLPISARAGRPAAGHLARSAR